MEPANRIIHKIQNSDTPSCRYTNCISILIISTIIFSLYAAFFFYGKSLYPVSDGRSIDFFNQNKSFQTALFNPMYLDHGATDWIEAPINAVVHKGIEQREWPTWDPYNSLGMPIIGNLNGATFSPFTFLLNFNNSEIAWNFIYVCRVLFACIFTFLFLRRMHLSHLSSITGALCFGLTGYSQLHLNMFHYNVDAMLPFLMWTTSRLISNISPRNFTLVILAFIGIILGGNPQNLILCGSLAAVFLLIKTINSSSKFKTISIYFLGAILAVGICAFYEISFLEIFIRSLKYHDGVGSASLPLTSLFGLLFPILATTPSLASNYLPYWGIIPTMLIIAGWGITSNNRIELLTFSGFSCFLMLKAIGFPLVNWIGLLPILDNILFIKYLSPLFFSLSIVIAICIENILFKNNQNRIIFALLATTALVISCFYFDDKIKLVHLNSFHYAVILITLLLCFAFCIVLKRQRNLPIYVCALLTLAITELVFYRLYKLPQYIDYGVMNKQPDFIDFIKQDRTNDYDRIFGVGTILMGNSAARYNIQDIRGLSATTDLRYYEFMKELILGGAPDLHPFTTTSSKFSPQNRQVLDMLGVKYIIFDDCRSHEIPNTKLVYSSQCMHIYKNLSAFNRAFIIRETINIDDDSSILNALKSGKYDLSKIALIKGSETAENKMPEQIIHNSSASNNQDIVNITSYLNNKVIINVNSHTDGILVLSELFFPGWKAHINGKEVDILNVNYALRGVAIKRGEQNIVFSYQPQSLTIGLIISILSILLSICICASISYNFGNKNNSDMKCCKLKRS